VRFMHAFKRYEQNKNTVQQKGKIDMYTWITTDKFNV
jgi:hypothetical protein